MHKSDEGHGKTKCQWPEQISQPSMFLYQGESYSSLCICHTHFLLYSDEKMKFLMPELCLTTSLRCIFQVLVTKWWSGRAAFETFLVAFHSFLQCHETKHTGFQTVLLCYCLKKGRVISYGFNSPDNLPLPPELKQRWNDNTDTHKSANKKLLPAALYTM